MIAAQDMAVVVWAAAIAQIACPDFPPADKDRDFDLLVEHLLELVFDRFLLRPARRVAYDRLVHWHRNLGQDVNHDVLHFERKNMSNKDPLYIISRPESLP